MTNFIYLVDLDEPLVCMNLINTKQLTSPYIAHYSTYKTEYPIYNIELENLLTDINSTQIGFCSPRFQYIILSNWSRNGLKVGIGMTDTKFYSQTDIDRINRIAELEIEFERVRRKINKNLPSRLSCIFLAEDNIDGRLMLKNMFFRKTNIHIANVEVGVCLCNHKADSKWIEEYEKTNSIKSIENYWNGIHYDNFPQFEYLVEGTVLLKTESDYEFIKNNFDNSRYSS